MKIYISDKRIKKPNFRKIQKKFPNINFETNLENSYDADAIVVEPNYVTEENINKYTNLKWIQSYRAGFDTVDFNILKKKGITFTNAKDIYSIAIAEDVVLKILMLNRNVKTYLENMENQEWLPNFNEPELYKSTIGIIGMGSIAIEIAKRLKAFNTKVLGYRRSDKKEKHFNEVLTKEEGLKKLLEKSDYVVLTVPLNEDTKDMMNYDRFKLMKKDALLINIARGEVVNQEDLIKALEEGLIRGAALDVTTPEPLPKDNPLWKMANVYITPHSSAASPHIHKRLTKLIIENIEKFSLGEELKNIV